MVIKGNNINKNVKTGKVERLEEVGNNRNWKENKN